MAITVRSSIATICNPGTSGCSRLLTYPRPGGVRNMEIAALIVEEQPGFIPRHVLRGCRCRVDELRGAVLAHERHHAALARREFLRGRIETDRHHHLTQIHLARLDFLHTARPTSRHAHATTIAKDPRISLLVFMSPPSRAPRCASIIDCAES
ncbi:hypothetical protein [Bifidobacterium choerinum]|uniref:hypothetical protein n=1 Tax=Bifidobacterium choerinum TaxID=35760 RepID=UPI0012FD4A42|nr:hypothetical protein [Bifidobacterium choerinum]